MTAASSNALFEYVAAPDSSYSVTVRGETVRNGTSITDLHLVSQTWHGLRWEHHLQVCRPEKLEFTDTVLLYNTGLDATEAETAWGMALAQTTGMVCAFLYHVPNQPLFEGLSEDALIAYTLVQHLETGETDWPLLLPMVKSVTSAMDALQIYLPEATNEKVVPTRFVISGASKRGWNSWLVAAFEARDGGQGRVAGIVPMVYDNLNLFAQMPHQVEVWGGYSERIDDYTDLDLQARMATPSGQALAALIDPYTYRDSITVPKLIVNGTNDAYWATDALNLYWDALSGPKSVLYVPNTGHNLRDGERVFHTAAAFLWAIGAQTTLPCVSMRVTEDGSSLRVGADVDKPVSIGARLWAATAPTQDFRGAAWQSVAMRGEGSGQDTGRWQMETLRPESGCLALFVEFELRADPNLIYTLSTPIKIILAER